MHKKSTNVFNATFQHRGICFGGAIFKCVRRIGNQYMPWWSFKVSPHHWLHSNCRTRFYFLFTSSRRCETKHVVRKKRSYRNDSPGLPKAGTKRLTKSCIDACLVTLWVKEALLLTFVVSMSLFCSVSVTWKKSFFRPLKVALVCTLDTYHL